MTTDKDLYRAFSKQESIQPSSGFVSSVMGAVRAAQSTPPPIAFPWKRALPGLLIAVAMVIAVFAAWFGFLALGKTDSTASVVVVHWLNRTFQLGLTWIASALVITCGCVKLSMKVADMRL